MKQMTTSSLDLAKNVFQLHGITAQGASPDPFLECICKGLRPQGVTKQFFALRRASGVKCASYSAALVTSI
ncbi:MAG: hypothetical protein Q8O82_05410 [Pseudorhodobacter sp.]|nr:hypothetical protein [Pseudorhodobacter sp.]